MISHTDQLSPVQALRNLPPMPADDRQPDAEIAALEARLKYACELLANSTNSEAVDDCDCHWCQVNRLLAKLTSEGLI